MRLLACLTAVVPQYYAGPGVPEIDHTPEAMHDALTALFRLSANVQRVSVSPPTASCAVPEATLCLI